MANNIIFFFDASRTFWVDFERYVGGTFFAGPGNPALLPEIWIHPSVVPSPFDLLTPDFWGNS